MNNRLPLICLTASLAFGLMACGDEGEGPDPAANNAANNGGGKTDEVNNGTNNGGPPVKEGPSVCAGAISNDSGRELGDGDAIIKSLDDPIANFVLHPGESCPGSYAEVMEKLRQLDTAGCEGDDKKKGITAMVVSESAQLMEEPTSYRVAVTRTCNDRARHHLFFSLFGVQAGATSLPEAAEVMAFDATTNSYNYYEVSGGHWTYFGNSQDMIAPGASTRCAQCHTGGGLVMKELDTPWVHWEGHEDIPGAKELVDAHDDLGFKATGSTMEGLVKAGNREWNDARLEHLERSGSVKRLLEPLFCSVEVNLDNGADFKSSNLSRIPNEFYFDPAWGIFGSLTMPFDIYSAALETSDQFMHDGSGPVNDSEGSPHRDTIFDFVFPERAHADMDYVDKLEKAGVVDEDFIKDVLAIDFTRPIFSGTRCGLLDFAPDTVDELTPDRIRAGFIANLEGADAPGAAELLGHLNTTGDAATHRMRVQTYFDACKARDQAEHMNDVMMVVTRTRNEARDLHVFEFPLTMPFSNISVDESVHFHPETCELTTD